MSVRINTNIEAINAQRNLSLTGSTFAKSVEKLSSGLRINRAADDAAGLAISEGLRAQVNGTNQAQRNAQDAISMIQTGEGALNQVHAMLQRMRELAVQSANGTLQDRTPITDEVTQLSAEIDRIAKSTQFNGIKLLDGTTGGAGTISGVGASLSVANGVSGMSAPAAKAGSYTLAIAAVSGGKSLLTLSDGTQSEAMNVTVPTSGTSLVSFKDLGVNVVVNSALGSTAVAATNGFTVAAGAAGAQFQIGANNVAGVDTFTATFGNVQVANLFATAPDLSTATGAQAAIGFIDSAISSVSQTRGTLGAYQNRLENTVASLGVTAENLSASESRIRDLDVAAEMVKFTKTQILQQAGTAILAQANQAPQNILTLLR